MCASAVVMVVMLDTPCSEVGCKTTGYPLHSHVSPSLPLLCVTVCHQVSTELYSYLHGHFLILVTSYTRHNAAITGYSADSSNSTGINSLGMERQVWNTFVSRVVKRRVVMQWR